MARRGPSRGQPQSGRGGEQPLVLCWGETAGGGGGAGRAAVGMEPSEDAPAV